MIRLHQVVGKAIRCNLPSWILTVFSLGCLAGCTPGEASPSGTSASAPARHVVSVAAASDLKFALDELAKSLKEQSPDIDLRVTHGSSGNFFAQLSNHAPFDVYLSADIDYPDRLVEQGLAVAETRFVYAIGHLVVWVPNSSPLDVEQGIEVLADAAVRKIAMANPAHAPYGRAALAALKHHDIYDRVKDRLVLGENVTQATQYVESGAADVGLIALSLAVAPAMRDKGRYWEVPVEAYPPLEQGGVILSWTKEKDAAQRFTGFLTGEHGRRVLGQYGFVLPGE